MVDLKKMGVLLGSTVLSFGMLSSIANASSTVNEQPEKVRIQVASTETVVTKNDLIKKFRKLFPNQFDFLTSSDFQTGNSHYYPDDGTLRHELSFSKTVNGKQLYGSLGFVGENLDIEQFYYQSPNEAEALYPAKVSKDEARKIAVDFIKKFSAGDNYQLESNPVNYFPTQLLTEPIRYPFSFALMENQVPIADQRIEVVILGNGEVAAFYRNATKIGKPTFDDVKQIKNKNDIVAKVKENLTADLYYQINTDFLTGKRSVQLIYQPTIDLQGVHASSGKWLTATGYSADFPKVEKIKMITATPLPPKQKGISVEQAKKMAQQLLASTSDKVKLNIDAIEEIENDAGQTVIRVHYMYQFVNGGTGSTLEINKKTGEITQYHDLTGEIQVQLGKKTDDKKAISEQVALTQAIKYVKEWIPSYLHNYAMPITEPYFDKEQGTYSMSFPRIVNGIPVIGDEISVRIAADGTLQGLNVNYQEMDKWPSRDKVISQQAAKVIFNEALSLKLTYMKQGQNRNDHHYNLVYVPVFNEEAFSFIDANTGQWNSLWNRKNSTFITHPFAQEELNYLIQANILDVKDSKTFDGDAPVSKGEALKIIINSLSYFYEGSYLYAEEDREQTFTNIDTKHPHYRVIERAVELGIVKANGPSFAADAPITREELAVWYIRILGLEQAAKDGSIYKLDFADAGKVNKEYNGHVSLASSLGLVKADENNFNPDRPVTYAELAVSTIRLAHKMFESGKGLY